MCLFLVAVYLLVHLKSNLYYSFAARKVWLGQCDFNGLVGVGDAGGDGWLQ